MSDTGPGIPEADRSRAVERFVRLEQSRTQPGSGLGLSLAQAVAQVDPAKVTTCVVQGGIGDIGGASVVLPYTDQARRLGDRARDDATLESCD